MFKNAKAIAELLSKPDEDTNCQTVEPNKLPGYAMRFYSTELEAKNAARGGVYYYCPTNHTWYVQLQDGQEAAILR
jgi:hypothetical protein